MDEKTQKFIQELIETMGEPEAIKLLELTARFKQLRDGFVSGDPAAVSGLIRLMISLEPDPEMPVTLKMLIPAIIEGFLLRRAENVARMALASNPKESAEISAAVQTLRKLMNGDMAREFAKAAMQETVN